MSAFTISERAGAASARPITEKSRPIEEDDTGATIRRLPKYPPISVPTMTEHEYRTHLVWQGTTGSGYRTYSRTHRAVAPPSDDVTLSADPHFRGDDSFLNPEQLVVMAASSCQLLSFLALAARRGVDVVDYEDDAHGVMPEDVSPAYITRIVLSPVVQVAPGTDHDVVHALVSEAHDGCYIANSLKSQVTVDATVVDA